MQRLRQLREERSMTQVRLSMELGVSQETVSGYETGKALPPADMLIKLAKRLNTSVDYLLELSDVKCPGLLNESQLTRQEQELLACYRSLPALQQERLLGYAMGLLPD